MKAIILSIGDELVLGQTVDTNSAWLSQQLAAVGVAVAAHLTVGDDQHGIEQAILESVGRCDVLLISGGLGPTEDDLTRQALAAVMGVPLELNQQWLEQLRGFFEKRGRTMPDANRIQAMIPRGAAMIWNTCGTAAGIDAAYQSGDQKTTCRIFVMPGVPKEMFAMFSRDVLPHLRQAAGGAIILQRTLHTFGLGESHVAEKIGPLMMRQRNPSVGTTVSQGVVSLRMNARFASIAEAQRELAATEAACRAALGDLIYGADGEPLAAVVGNMLAERGQTVATAESCTGGLLAKYLTDQSGSSAWFGRGYITYSNDAKQAVLGVAAETLRQHGAVSEAVVVQMATAAAALAGSDYGLAISGIAGPTGGTPEKPVGTVCIALHDSGQASHEARTFNMAGDREMVRDRSAKMALTMLRFRLLGQPLPF